MKNIRHLGALAERIYELNKMASLAVGDEEAEVEKHSRKEANELDMLRNKVVSLAEKNVELENEVRNLREVIRTKEVEVEKIVVGSCGSASGCGGEVAL